MRLYEQELMASKLSKPKEDEELKMIDLEHKLKDSFSGELRFNEPMSEHTSLKIGGPVEVMAFPEDPLSLRNILFIANEERLPVHVFGRGTNLLVSDDVIKGLAISLKAFGSIEAVQSRVSPVEEDSTGDAEAQDVTLFVGSGVPLSKLVNYAQKNGYSGLESLAGIPGLMGGAVYMNAGSFGTEMKDIIISVAIMSKEGHLIILEKEKLDFSYRKSGLPKDSLILSANINLKKDDPEEIEKRTKEYMSKKKETQPLGELSAGCVFMNPEGDYAGRLIEKAGCKGMKSGNVEVSTVHANYFINKGGASCSDFIKLMKLVREKVEQSSGIILEPEIYIVGEI
jgi:UDP-N-acetylmuramate dehydrogenase